ncbi:MAG: hypothetical protein ACI9GW_003095, partial [Halieaceae bacterium]
YEKSGYEEITTDIKSRLVDLREQYQVPRQDPSAPWYHDTLVRLLEWWFR